MKILKRPSGAGSADQDNIKELSLLAEEGGTSTPIIRWSGQPGAHHICPRTSWTRGVLRGCSSSRQDRRRTTTGPEKVSLGSRSSPLEARPGSFIPWRVLRMTAPCDSLRRNIMERRGSLPGCKTTSRDDGKTSRQEQLHSRRASE